MPSKKTDIFSYGVVLTEIMSRDDPWPGLTPSEVCLEFVNFLIFEAADKVIAGQRMEIPKEWPEVVQKLIRKVKDLPQQESFRFSLEISTFSLNWRIFSTIFQVTESHYSFHSSAAIKMPIRDLNLG